VQQPVSCSSCGWVRDRALPGTERCFPCGGGTYYEIKAGHRVACTYCGIHRNDYEPVCGCGCRTTTKVAAQPPDVSALLSELTDRVADLIQVDPSPVHIKIAAALSDATLAHVRRDARSYPIEGRTA